MIALGVHPMVTFFLGGSRQALDSLAVMPVINALSFIFRSVGLAYQEVAIALLDGTRENFRKISRFAMRLGVAAALCLIVIAFTPLADFWFRSVSGLNPELAEFSVFPLRVFSVIPALAVLLAFQRAVLVFGRKTRAITVATVLEVSGIVAVLFLTVRVLDFVGAVAAVVALLAGRVVGNSYLMFPCYFLLRSSGMWGAGSRRGESDCMETAPDLC
jgi:hypothetical protein